MAKWIYAEEKKYPGDDGYQPANSFDLSDYHKWVINKRIKKRIQKDNRKWMSKEISKWVGVIVFLVIMFLGMLKQ